MYNLWCLWLIFYFYILICNLNNDTNLITNASDLNTSLPKLFKHIGLVITIADGIVTVIGINDVGYMKQ